MVFREAVFPLTKNYCHTGSRSGWHDGSAGWESAVAVRPLLAVVVVEHGQDGFAKRANIEGVVVLLAAALDTVVDDVLAYVVFRLHVSPKRTTPTRVHHQHQHQNCNYTPF